MKKFISVLGAVIIFLSLCSCGSNTAHTVAGKIEGEEGPESSYEPEMAQNAVDESDEDCPAIEINSGVIYEGHDVVITTKNMEKTKSGWNINLLIENNSSLNLGFNAHAYAINGIMTQNNIYDMDCDVAAGKKANVSLELENSILDQYGITEIRCVDALLWAYDNDKYFKEFDTNQIEIKTSLYDATHDVLLGETIYDTDGIKVEFLVNDGNTYWFGITNTTGAYVDFDFDEISINDFTSSDINYDLIGVTLLNNCQVVLPVIVSDEFISANDISTIESIEWNMSVRPYGEYSDAIKIGPIVYAVK